MKSCLQSNADSLDICEYGVAYYIKKEEVLRKEALVPLRYISYNLRHEINPILSVIVEEAGKIDKSISTRRIDLSNPASKIVGSTIILDHFIQMISGVNEFHPSGNYAPRPVRERILSALIKKYFDIHSIIKDPRRAYNLELHLNFDNNVIVSFSADIVEYLLSILIDNIWKYSATGTRVEISLFPKTDELADLIFQNISSPVPQDIDIFGKGVKLGEEAGGFGYGLYWANILIFHYNRLSGKEEELQLVHNQKNIGKALSKQEFILNNLIVKFS
jgi:hypothetical protein